MLPKDRRIRSSAEFGRCVRHGRRVRRRDLILYCLAQADPQPTRAGLVVGRSVGRSVVRHRVARRLRHVLMTRVPALPDGWLVVVRALPGAAMADSIELAGQVDSGLSLAMRTSRDTDQGHGTGVTR